MVFKEVHYPTRQSLKHGAKEIRVPEPRGLTKMAVTKGDREILAGDAKFAVTKQRSDTDIFVENFLDRDRQREEKYVLNRKKKKEESQ